MSSESDCPRLLSLAVHELRTPVTIVAGYVRMILKDKAGPVPEMQRKLLEEAEKSCARLSTLLAELSEVGHLDSGRATLNVGRVEMDRLLREVADALPGDLDRPIRVELANAAHGVTLSADATRLRQALLSIARAVARENVKDETVRLDARLDAAGPRVVISVGAPAAVEHLTGGSARPESFDEFRGGYGMLLALARRVIEAHGGTLRAGDGPFTRIAAQVILPT